jgi:hypothetical protein
MITCIGSSANLLEALAAVEGEVEVLCCCSSEVHSFLDKLPHQPREEQSEARYLAQLGASVDTYETLPLR